MPNVSYDRQSFAIDGRRVWLVSGTMPYTSIPRGLWRDRLREARQAGLNCIETPVVWSAHERKPGTFDFEGDLDLRAFVKAVAEEGLYCILRPGPYVGADVPNGGLPAHLLGRSDKKGNRLRLREDEPLFLEAVDAYLRAVMEQVGDLQVAQTGKQGSSSYHYAPGSAAGGYQGEGGGPIIVMQVEHAWECHDPEQPYLDRLVSMLRQHGCTVPLTNANNLWQPVEGTIDTWRGDTALPAMMRQLAHVQPDAPPFVSHLQDTTVDSGTLQYRLAALTGVAAQFNLAAIPSGTNAAVKRVCTFVSQFGSILANSEPAPAPVVALEEADHPTAVLHQRSSQGELVMLIKSENDKTQQTQLMLAEGLTLDVPHSGQRAAWVLLNASLGGRTVLNYTTLSPWALIDRELLVVFGPPGATGDVSIDGEQHRCTVPTGKTPLVIKAGPIHVAVLNHEQIDAAYRGPGGLVIGCDGLDRQDKPRYLTGWGTQVIISADGTVTRKRISAPPKPTTPSLAKWQALSLRPLVGGSDPAFDPIDGPAPLHQLGSEHGYGWYRLQQKKAPTGKVLPHANIGRLHVYRQGKLSALIGTGEGAEPGLAPLMLDGLSVLLADDIGQPHASHAARTEPAGLAEHLHTVKPIKPGKPSVIRQAAGEPFAVTGYAPQQSAGARPMSEAISWSIKPESRKPIILEIDALGQPCVISVNGQPLSYYADGLLRLLLDPAEMEAMTGGKNTIALELLEPLKTGVQIDKHIRFYQTTGIATPKEDWAFAPLTVPAAEDGWRPLPKSLPSQPAWFRSTFDLDSADTPLTLTIQGMSKGMVFLNGHSLGRFWLQTREGKVVEPQHRLYLPEPWMSAEEANELLLFDEHGRPPSKCVLSYGDA